MENFANKYYSFCSGPFADGCALCVKGRKLVLFITGVCGQKCFYCPISEGKYMHDDVYANEWKLKDPENPVELIKEAKLMGAKGAGITGGDPLARNGRCVKYIKLLKKEFGNAFHIHLYTPLLLVNEKNLKLLYEAGLDEIRFHPDLDNEKFWPRLELARKFKWNVGVEIPCVPGYEKKTKRLIDYIADKVDFLNLNELELSDTTIPHYKLDYMGFKQKTGAHYGIVGSKELGIELIKYAKRKKLATHFCTAKLKDRIQVGERLKNRAENASFPFDKITDEGLFIRGAIYLEGIEPREKYESRLMNADKKKAMAALKSLHAQLLKSGLKQSELSIDEKRLRIIMSEKSARNLAKTRNKGIKIAIVEEYPTEDAFLVELEFLN